MPRPFYKYQDTIASHEHGPTVFICEDCVKDDSNSELLKSRYRSLHNGLQYRNTLPGQNDGHCILCITNLGFWFVNVYKVEQSYGGPEEGGWYRRHYTPLYSVVALDEKPFAELEDEEAIRVLLRLWGEDDFDNQLTKYCRHKPAARCTHAAILKDVFDIVVCVEDKLPVEHIYPEGGYE